MAEEMECPNCGMLQEQWSANEGRGYMMAGDVYCCQGCAEDSGCTCDTADRKAPEGADADHRDDTGDANQGINQRLGA
jgi:hypothetical protein